VGELDLRRSQLNFSALDEAALGEMAASRSRLTVGGGDRGGGGQFVQNLKADVIDGQMPNGQFLGFVGCVYFAERNAFAKFSVIPS
jgi:hypothetical protein